MTKISRTKAAEIIKTSKGRFFSVKFIKENQEERSFHCNFRRGGDLGYFLVNVKNEGVKNLNIKTLKELVINKTHYKIA